jgi:glutathione synthase/RimK-type ligase-like ATP-grasp enzyme
MFPKRPTQRAHVLILNGSPNFMYGIDSERRLHFHINYPSQLPRALADELHFSAVFSCDPAGRAAAARLPKPDLIINNYCNGELLMAEGHLAEVSEFADSFGVPVVNHPSKVPATTRDRSAELVADLPGLVVPKTRRFSKAGRPLDELAEAVEATSAYPLITRNLSSQQGVGMTLVENRPALIDALTTKTEDDFFVIPFIDSRGPTGYFRKIRAAIIDGEIFIIRVDYDSDWNVHGRKSDERVAFYLKNPDLLSEEDRICKDPKGALGETAMAALHAIAERIPLDIFGVDFDVANDGRLVFYEANATMNFLSTARPEVDHPRQAEEHMVAAIRNYLFGLI